ncbi:hypothetical protein Tco_1386228 [Tanacetum coccineum]
MYRSGYDPQTLGGYVEPLRRYNQDVSNKTHCDCKPPHPIPIQTAWTTDNPGRRFRGCPIRDKSKKCGVYGVWILNLLSDFYKGLVYSLMRENKAMERMNRMLLVLMDGTRYVVMWGLLNLISTIWVHPERPWPDVTSRIAERFKSRPAQEFVKDVWARIKKDLRKAYNTCSLCLGLCQYHRHVEIEKKVEKELLMKIEVVLAGCGSMTIVVEVVM